MREILGKYCDKYDGGFYTPIKNIVGVTFQLMDNEVFMYPMDGYFIDDDGVGEATIVYNSKHIFSSSEKLNMFFESFL